LGGETEIETEILTMIIGDAAVIAVMALTGTETVTLIATTGASVAVIAVMA
jgi:hypothetical protein